MTEQHSYDSYGNSDDLTGNPFRYRGRRLDEETGLYYYRARYYSPAIGRFLQTDPIGYGDGLNWYAYVSNDPMNNTDPTGKAQKKVLGPSKVWDGVGNKPKKQSTGKMTDKHTAKRSGRSGTKNKKKLGWKQATPKKKNQKT